MSRRYALVDGDGLVINIVEWDGEAAWSPPASLTPIEADASVSKGWSRTEGLWTAPETEVPEWT